MGFERNKKMLIKFLVSVIIVLLAFTGYIILVNNSRYKIKSSVKYIFNKTDETLQLAQNSAMTNAFLENKTELTNRVVAKVSLSDDTIESFGPSGKKMEDLINNSIIETVVKSDVINKYMDMGINYSYNNEKIEANAYISDNELYLYIKDYFDKYLKVDASDFNVDQFFNQITSGVKVDEIRYLMNIFKQSVVDGIDYSKINSSKAEIDIDEEKLSVNKTTITIDTELENKVTTILLNKILRDTKAKEIILKLSDSKVYPNVSYIEEDIKNQLSSLETTTYDNEILGEYSIYTSGIFSNVIRNEFKSFDSKENAIQITTYKTLTFDTQIAIYENNELTSQANIKKTPENKYDIAIIFGQDISIDIKGTISQSLTDISYIVRISGAEDVKGDIRLETTTTSKNEINQIFKAKLNTPESYGTIDLTVNSTLKTVAEITKPDFKNNVNLNSLTEAQSADITKKIENKNSQFIKIINEIFSSLMGM